jgi:hypothetical protein
MSHRYPVTQALPQRYPVTVQTTVTPLPALGNGERERPPGAPKDDPQALPQISTLVAMLVCGRGWSR